MESFEKEFIMEMFLENESVATINRLMVTATDIVKETDENLTLYNDEFKKELVELAPSNSRVLQSINLMSDGGQRYKDFFKNIVLQYSDSEYEETFHMKKSTFEELVKVLKENMTVQADGAVVPLEKKLLVFLWLLTSDASFQEVGLLFGIHKSTASYIFYEIAELIIEQRYRYITWPTIEEQHITRLKINSRFHFPNCIGIIDACRLRVGSKRNKKGKPEIVLLQAVCDESLMFLDVYVGDIGRTKKAKVLKDSPLLKELSNFIDFDNHILGDAEYKLRVNLITPFTSEELLTDEEMKFNEVHWKARAYIGRAFELLRERFRKLNLIDINKPEAVSTVVTAACVLHNFILIHEGIQDVKEEPVTCDEGVVVDTNIVKTASEKRQFLCNFVNFIDSS